MAIPKYNELYDPFLTAISDGKIHTAFILLKKLPLL